MGKNIEYDAYISLDWNCVPPDMRVNFLEYFQFLLNSDFSGLEKLLLTTLELDKFPQRSDDELIEGILAYSIRDLQKKGLKRTIMSVMQFAFSKSSRRFSRMNFIKLCKTQTLYNLCRTHIAIF